MSVQYEARDGVAIINFDDGKANVFSHESLKGLEAALDQAASDGEVRAVLIAGRPGRFSAGFDLAAMSAGGDSMVSLVEAGGRFAARLLLEEKPVVAACTGHALAMGALVLLAVDHRVGAAGAWKIGLNEVAIGMSMPRWGVELARYRLRPSELDWRLILGQTADPEEAIAAGFLDRIVPAEEVQATALQAATKLAELKTGAVAATKRRAREEVVRRMLEGMREDLAQMTFQPG